MREVNRVSEKSHFTQKSFPCKECGASLVFSARNSALKCEYCGYVNYIYPPKIPIYEHSLDETLHRLQTARFDLEAPKEIKCPVCAAAFKLTPHIRSTRCPYCDAAIVTNLDIFMPLSPEYLLPFKIDQKEAREIFEKWVGSLWFAPAKLEKYTRSDSKFEGIYLPYWTYDSMTTTRFQGYRGDTYYKRVGRRVFIDGRERIVDEMVPEIRWQPVSGEIVRHFDDVLIGATKTLPRKLADTLKPWDLENLVAFTQEYLSGFESETYSVALDEGFDYAKKYMEYELTNAVRRKIGGDHQKISYMQIYHDRNSFKYILLPVWTAHFRYKDKEYRFAINARSGTIRGERPYSRMKIFIAVSLALLFVFSLIYLDENPQILHKIELIFR